MPYALIGCDVAVLAIGESWVVTGENKAVSNISIPEEQIALLKRAKMMRPLRELKAFEKVFVPKGEAVDVTLSVGYDELGYFLPDSSYTVERGKIEIYIGENCLTSQKAEICIL